MSCFIVNVLKCMCVNEEKNLFCVPACVRTFRLLQAISSLITIAEPPEYTFFSFTHPSEEVGHNTEFLFKKKNKVISNFI